MQTQISREDHLFCSFVPVCPSLSVFSAFHMRGEDYLYNNGCKAAVLCEEGFYLQTVSPLLAFDPDVKNKNQRPGSHVKDLIVEQKYQLQLLNVY